MECTCRENLPGIVSLLRLEVDVNMINAVLVQTGVRKAYSDGWTGLLRLVFHRRNRTRRRIVKRLKSDISPTEMLDYKRPTCTSYCNAFSVHAFQMVTNITRTHIQRERESERDPYCNKTLLFHWKTCSSFWKRPTSYGLSRFETSNFSDFRLCFDQLVYIPSKSGGKMHSECSALKVKRGFLTNWKLEMGHFVIHNASETPHCSLSQLQL